MHQDIGGPLIHICPDCGKGFIYKTSLTTHIYYKHKKKGSKQLVGQGTHSGSLVTHDLLFHISLVVNDRHE